MSALDAATRYAVVTGGGTGIGRAIARRLARSGYACVVAGRRIEPLAATVKEIEAQGGEAVAVVADVTLSADRDKALDAVATRCGTLHVLVNNAGGGNAAPLFSRDVEHWRNEFALNVEAAAFLSFDAIARMAEGAGGSIVNVASVYGQVALNARFYRDSYPSETPAGPTRPTAYGAAKSALRLLTRELAVAAAPMGVRVNTVSPGMISVERTQFSPSDLAQLEAATPLRRFGRPDEVASAVTFLASDEASFITGAELVVDGGWTAW